MKKISIITATYNCEDSIERTLTSYASQDYPLKELIVIDGGSADGTTGLVRDFGISHRMVSEPDSGIYDALNKGIRMADGDIIGFLHAGDRYYHCGILTRIAETFNNCDPDGVYGDLRYMDTNAGKIIRYWKSGEFGGRKSLYRGWMPPHPTLYLKKEVYRDHGLFDHRLKISADYDFMLRILLDPAFRLAYIPDVLVDMEVGGKSNGSLSGILQKSREDLGALRKNGMKPALPILLVKNFRKFDQFFKRQN
ncbi:MAG: glycosyltransferase family 2 protein [Bacteroidota bacterium]